MQLAWPEALILRHSRFVGFAMRKIAFDRTLELDYLLNRRQSAQEGFDADYGKLLTVCFNLASLINSLHEQRIAIVDLKPMNVKVYKAELYVSILDCDGFHIATEELRHEAPQVTPEYLAPEFQDKAVTHPEAQDSFALATIIFRLLNYGIHPFTGVASGHHQLSAGAWRAASSRDYIPMEGWPTPVCARCRRACTKPSLTACAISSTGPLRPQGHRGRVAREWVELLSPYASKRGGQLLPCERGHLRFADHPCPTCMREALIRGAAVRRRSFVARVQAAPARTLKYVRRTLRQTHSSPFQAALAQAQLFAFRQLAPTAPVSTRNAIALEILWVTGLLIGFWWAS